MKQLLVIPLAFACCSGLMLSGCKGKENGPFHLVKEQIVPAAVTSVQVNWIAGDVKILKSADHSIHIEQSAPNNLPEKNQFVSSVANGTLTITDNSKHGWELFSSTSTDLNLYFPDETFDSISLSCTSGSISGANLRAKSLVAASTSADIAVSGRFETMNLKSVSGTVRETDLQAKSLSAKTTSGDITVGGALETVSISSTSGAIHGEKLRAKSLGAESASGEMDVKGSFETLNLKSISGEMEIFSSQMPRAITLASTSGEIGLNLPRNDGFTLVFHSTSGKLNSSFALQQNGEKQIYKNGSGRITVETTSGGVTIHQI